MDRLRFLEVKGPVARVMNTDPADPAVLDYANESHRRLVRKGKWVGTLQHYRICTNSDGCFAWPRQIDTIEGYWLCDIPGTVRNGFYETSINGPGYLDSGRMQTHTLVDRTPSCVFNQPNNTTSTVFVQSDAPEAAGLRILLRGYDDNMNWIRTQDPASGNWIDGQYIVISNQGAYSAVVMTRIVQAIKPVTVSAVRLWQWDTILSRLVNLLAYYEPDETLPIYRCSLVPGLGQVNGCNCHDSSTACNPNKVTVLAKLRHIDATVDNDFYLLQNLSAIKLGVMAIMKEERNLIEEAGLYWNGRRDQMGRVIVPGALTELEDELATFNGTGAVPIIKTESSQTWGANVLNPVTLGPRIY